MRASRQSGSGETAPRGAGPWPAAAAAGLFIFTLVVFFPSLFGGFVSLDDYQYVVDNPLVREPGAEGAQRFLTEVAHPSTVSGYYQPLTMLSLMLDAAIAGGDGRDPFVYHATNIVLHALNAVGVLVILRLCFGGVRIPLIGALLFAVHPVQVESVAWISQRKTVLASLFALASVAAYLQYGRRGGRGWLAAAWCLYGLGTLAKPTIVPLALVLPLLDVWPLGRRVRGALLEKMPFAALMLVLGGVAWVSQAGSGAALGVADLSEVDRVVRWAALSAYNLTLYLGNLVWPMSLSPYRPLPADLSFARPEILVSAIVAIGLVLVCLGARRFSRPLFVGGLSFLIPLLPALGGLRFADTCVADRFLYLPLAFLTLLPAALLARIASHMPRRAASAQLGAALFAVPLLVLCRGQQSVWRDSRALWTHIREAVPDLPKANYELAGIYLRDGAFAEARACAEAAVRGDPTSAHYRHILGRALTRTGAPEAALEAIRRALAQGLGRKQSWGYISLAEAYLVLGDAQRAREAANRAAALGRDDARSLAMLGDVALHHAHNCAEAERFYRAALERDAGDLEARYGWASALKACGRAAEALAEYEAIIERARRLGRRYPRVEAEAEALRQAMAERRGD